MVQDRFRDLVAAAEQLPDGLVLDGELVVWDTAAGRLSFEALQRRAAARGRTATALAAKTPAFFIAFDALQIDGIELLALPYAERRRRLEVLFAARQLTLPWTLCPMTTDPATAREWMEDWTDVSGVEGLVLKKLNQRYRPGSRDRALATVIDLATREVIGYAMADHHRAELVADALEMAAGRGALKEGCIAHSDRGSEYTSHEYRTLIRELKLRQSMGRTGSCYDNAAAESFFGLLKAEIGTSVWESHEAARADVFRFIEVEYNRTRLRKHPVYGYVTPLETRALTTHDLTPAA
ncbi:DDE-type integrase/transposase/recombinase [Streptomyces sp. NPDC058290]|uniref:ATP-dependent DNA ligase n=1 Tax=Streptomyces sp. NPDC058290 TaxID=3346426 RepID=UPI0036E810CF